MFDINKIGNSSKFLFCTTVAYCLFRNYIGFQYAIYIMPAQILAVGIVLALIINRFFANTVTDNADGDNADSAAVLNIDNICRFSYACARIYSSYMIFNFASKFLALCGLGDAVLLGNSTWQFMKENVPKSFVGGTILCYLQLFTTEGQPDNSINNIDTYSLIRGVSDNIARLGISLLCFRIANCWCLRWCNFSLLAIPVVTLLTDRVMQLIKEGESIEAQGK